ncbi:MAG: rRNA pseudouridine synthase [Chloroflexi bacterium]|nr:rRNA pseudouridine synthase [Chloroflexota bacterium]
MIPDGEEKRERLHKALAQAGVASRRASEEMIRQGRVAVNGRVVVELGTKVGPEDVITVDGRPIKPQTRKVYLMLNKPMGYVTTASDEFDRPTVMALVASQVRLFPVGRLDVDSEGLLLLTNDGDLAYRLTHPRFGVEKEYLALVDGNPTEKELEKLRQGVMLDDRKTAPAIVERLKKGPEGTWLRLIIHEGRKRQIRRMLVSVGYNVSRLIRVRVGPLRLGDLPSGQSRPLTREEIASIFRGS